jgi:hypothetical protein
MRRDGWGKREQRVANENGGLAASVFISARPRPVTLGFNPRQATDWAGCYFASREHIPCNNSGDEPMSAQDDIQFYINWAKERLDEMEATLTSLEGKIGGVQDEVRGMAAKVLADLRKKRDEFRDVIMKNAEANEAAWIAEGKTGGRLEDVQG